MRPVRHGFTLIELLVVLAIISVLTGIAFPAFSMVRASSRNAVCISNLRQLDAPIRAYSQAHGDRIPICNMLPALGAHGPESGLPQLLKGYLDPASEIWLCPADLDEASLSTGTSYLYMPGLLRYTPEVQMQVAKAVFLQKNLSDKELAKTRTDLEGQLLETFYSGVDTRPGGVGPRANYYPLLTDSADRHPGTRSPRNALFVDGSVREAAAADDASDSKADE